MTATDTFMGLLRGVLSDPGNDLPRLVLADWWEENGEPERAAYIREAIEHEKWFDPHEQAPRAIDERKRLAGLLAAWWPKAWPIRPPAGHDYLYLSESLGAAALSAPGYPGHRAVLTRGFASRLYCTAATWLAHADALFWNPEQTVACKGCDGKGEWFDGYDRWKDCRSCDGTGRVPRECPPTAQPIERVTLATWPGHEYDQPGGDVYWHVPRDWCRRIYSDGVGVPLFNRHPEILAGCAERWPGLVFTLPDAS